MPTKIERYLRNVDKIDGWLSNTSAVISFCLMKHQARCGTRGNVVEIGVFRGRYFIALAESLEPGEKAIAVDMFEEHYENLIPVEGGQRSVFKQNVATYSDPFKLILIETDSTKLQPRALTDLGPVRFMSIDGGHTRDIALNDLRLAEAVLTPDGIATYDDIIHPDWPGVEQAWHDYRAAEGSLTAVAIIPNKLLLCRPPYRDIYKALMRAAFTEALTARDRDFSGELIDHYVELPPDQLNATLGAAMNRIWPPSPPTWREKLKRAVGMIWR